MNLPINQIICSDTLKALKKLPDESVSMVLTSPPYYGLRDYGTGEWIGGDKDCDHKITNKIGDYQGDWDRPSRKEFSKIGKLFKCVVCKKEFKGKKGQKFCSTKCLNTLSNEQRTTADSIPMKKCVKCGAEYNDRQLGLESTPNEYLSKMKFIMLEIKRVLRADGTIWWNMGDTYGSARSEYGNSGDFARPSREKTGWYKRKSVPQFQKCLLMMPERFAFMMLDIGFILRNKIIWHKPNPMPSSVKDRFTTTWEYVYLFSKSKKYYFDLDAVRKPHKNPGAMKKYYEESFENKARRFRRRESTAQIVPLSAPHRGSKDKIKHDVAVKRTGNVSYTDPLHTKPYNPLGKNPGDVIRTDKGAPPGQNADLFRRKGHSGYYDKEGNLLINPLGKNPGDFWSITTQPFKGAHFAVFPERLCEAPIKAGCPKWICNKCGKPRKRITELKGDYTQIGEKEWIEYAKKKGLPLEDRKARQRAFLDLSKRGKNYSRKTIGFTDCSCSPDDPFFKGSSKYAAGIVLDPFCGSGTACLVAKKLGRNYIGIDLKKEYVEMARKRLNKIPEKLSKFI